MGTAYLYGNGGSGGVGGLGFEIVGGTTRPKKPTQNMIWANTDIDITEYALSAAEPESPVEGMLWLVIADSGNIKSVFTADKEWITVYPISAKQYISGVWVDADAKNYQNGAWVEYFVYFLNGDNQYTYLTGGWTGNGTVGADGISLDSANTASFDKYMHTVNAIDFSRFKKLKIDVSRYYDYGDLVSNKWIKVTIRTAKNGGGTELAAVYIYGTGITEFKIENVNQIGYLTIQTGNTSHITVKTIFA